MLHYTIDIIINRPKEQVFNYMTQLDNGDQLMDEVVASKNITGGPVGLGTRMTERVKFGPMGEELTWEITAFEANRLCTFETDGSFGRTKVSYLLEPAQGGTRVAAEVTIEIRGLFRLAQPVIQFSHMGNRKRYLAAIKKNLENDQGGAD